MVRHSRTLHRLTRHVTPLDFATPLKQSILFQMNIYWAVLRTWYLSSIWKFTIIMLPSLTKAHFLSPIHWLPPLGIKKFPYDLLLSRRPPVQWNFPFYLFSISNRTLRTASSHIRNAAPSFIYILYKRVHPKALYYPLCFTRCTLLVSLTTPLLLSTSILLSPTKRSLTRGKKYFDYQECADSF